MSTTSMEREQMTGVEPRALVEQLVAGPVFIERHVAGVTAHATSCGRVYKGRAPTEREACWRLLEAIAHRQAEIESCTL